MANFDSTAHWANVARHFADGEKFMENAIIQALDAILPVWRSSFEETDALLERIHKDANRSLKKIGYLGDSELYCNAWDRIIQRSFPNEVEERKQEAREEMEKMDRLYRPGSEDPRKQTIKMEALTEDAASPHKEYMVDLSRSNECLTLSWSEWSRILKLAESYGWIPYGAIPPEDWFEPGVDQETDDEHKRGFIGSMFNMHGWDGDYNDPLGQSVGDRDAVRMASRLMKALDDLPSNDPMFYTLEDVATFANKGRFKIEFAD